MRIIMSGAHKIFGLSSVLVLIILCLMFIAMAIAEERKIGSFPVVEVNLKMGEGLEQVKTHCSICHSLDYITMQPGFSSAQWRGIVNKMKKVFGAPIPESDIEIIIRYLSENYSKE